MDSFRHFEAPCLPPPRPLLMEAACVTACDKSSAAHDLLVTRSSVKHKPSRDTPLTWFPFERRPCDAGHWRKLISHVNSNDGHKSAEDLAGDDTSHASRRLEYDVLGTDLIHKHERLPPADELSLHTVEQHSQRLHDLRTKLQEMHTIEAETCEALDATEHELTTLVLQLASARAELLASPLHNDQCCVK
eukprot:CAMPEP_0119413794 /NCGR_PEP_ID=MMETSP1335-20130426/5973_1 /TAXON_ID=259385 /ORGANISM="Chrysoculter rhomboideus, Strain RCC1486" /LENGTH=189 /DNA_ID=CAMNT_0007438621 /DNA_START=1 /DNA_END=571 /DNA_ORIENTATION=-